MLLSLFTSEALSRSLGIPSDHSAWLHHHITLIAMPQASLITSDQPPLGIKHPLKGLKMELEASEGKGAFTKVQPPTSDHFSPSRKVTLLEGKRDGLI